MMIAVFDAALAIDGDHACRHRARARPGEAAKLIDSAGSCGAFTRAVILAVCVSLGAGRSLAQSPAAADKPSPMSPGHELDAAQLHERCRPVVGAVMAPRGNHHGGAKSTRLVPPERMEPLHQTCAAALVAKAVAAPPPKPGGEAAGAPSSEAPRLPRK